MALLTAGIMPARTARRTDHMGLLPAFRVHIVAVVLAVPPIVLLTAMTKRWPVQGLRWAPEALGHWWRVVAREFQRTTDTSALVTLGVVAVIVFFFLLMAASLTAWGACDERLRTSVRHAVRRTWLHTSHLALVGWLSCTFLVALVEILPGWCTRHPPERPAMPGTPQTPDAPEWQAYEKAMAAWKPKRDHYNHMVSFHLDGVPLEQIWRDTVGVICLVGSGWWLWGLFRAIGAPRAASGPTRAPLCEQCGYNLTGASLDGRCPECGASVRDSLGPDVRPGAVWERRGEFGWRRAWWRCAVEAIRRPTQFGRQLRLYGGTTDHRSFLFVAMLLAFGVATIAILEWHLLMPRLGDRFPTAHDLCVSIVLVGCGTSVALLFFTSGMAGLVGLALRRPAGHNVLAGAMQAASYLSAYVLTWGSLAALVPMSAIIAGEWLCYRLRCGDAAPIPTLLAYVWFVINALCLVVFVVAIRRMAGATRYANK